MNGKYKQLTDSQRHQIEVYLNARMSKKFITHQFTQSVTNFICNIFKIDSCWSNHLFGYRLRLKSSDDKEEE